MKPTTNDKHKIILIRDLVVVPDHARHQYILMDGMRWALWEVIKVKFFSTMADRFRVVWEGALWAHQPTDTSAQLARLEEAFDETYPDTHLILFADHGFVENAAFSRSDKYASPRYTHGNDSPFEVIVLWAWVMRL